MSEWGGRSINELINLPIDELSLFFEKIKLTQARSQDCREVDSGDHEPLRESLSIRPGLSPS